MSRTFNLRPLSVVIITYLQGEYLSRAAFTKLKPQEVFIIFLSFLFLMRRLNLRMAMSVGILTVMMSVFICSSYLFLVQ